MLETLSDAQVKKLPVYRDKWITIGMSTDSVSLEKCKEITIRHYKNLGLAEPEEFYLVESPRQAIKLLKEKYKLDANSIIHNFCYGFQDSFWLSYYDYFMQETDVKVSDDVMPLIELSKECGWWSPYENVVVFQNRPSKIVMEDGSVQCTTGPAIEYSDGFVVYIIDGSRVTEQIVMRPETLTLKQINKEDDLDIRSIMIDRFGWTRYLKESNAKCINKFSNLVEGTKEALFQSSQGSRLVVSCPTGRVFSIGVPTSCMTCVDAQSWLGSELEKTSVKTSDGNSPINVIART